MGSILALFRPSEHCVSLSGRVRFQLREEEQQQQHSLSSCVSTYIHLNPAKVDRSLEHTTIWHTHTHIYIYMANVAHALSSFPLFLGSAAGAAALKSGDAVRWWLLSIALATRGRAGAADPPLKSFSLLGFSLFGGSGWEKRG